MVSGLSFPDPVPALPLLTFMGHGRAKNVRRIKYLAIIHRHCLYFFTFTFFVINILFLAEDYAVSFLTELYDTLVYTYLPLLKTLHKMASATPRTHFIATIGADGIGPEVIQAGVQVLKKLTTLDTSFALNFKDYDWSSETYKKTGQYIPDGGLEELKKHDAILFGAVGAPGTFLTLDSV